MKGLHNQIALNNDQFPRLLSEAMNVLSDRKFNNHKLLKLRENERDRNAKKTMIMILVNYYLHNSTRDVIAVES